MSAEGSGRLVLNCKGHAVAGRVGQLEDEVGGEGLDVYRGSVESAAGLCKSTIGELQAEVVEVGAAVELHRPLGQLKAIGKVDYVIRLDDVGRADRRTGKEASGDSDGLDSLGDRDCQRAAVDRG